MKKIVLLSILSAFSLPLAAENAPCRDEKNCLSYTGQNVCKLRRNANLKPCCEPRVCNPTDWTLQLRGAAFFPLHEQIRKIYGAALPTIELESSYSLCKNFWSTCDQLLLWENIGWTFKTGKTLDFGYYTRLNLLPISVGIEYQVNMARNFDFYVGIGPTYSFLWVENDDDFSTSHQRKSQFGFTTKTGFRFTFCTNFFFDIFGDYLYTPFGKMHNSIQSINGNFSGFFVGGGFGGKW